jgi:hypothetical protein
MNLHNLRYLQVYIFPSHEDAPLMLGSSQLIHIKYNLYILYQNRSFWNVLEYVAGSGVQCYQIGESG